MSRCDLSLDPKSALMDDPADRAKFGIALPTLSDCWERTREDRPYSRYVGLRLRLASG